MAHPMESDGFKQHCLKTLNSASSLVDIKGQILNILSDIGFTDFDCSQAAKFQEFDFILSTFPESMLTSYSEESLHNFDIVSEHVPNSSSPIFASVVREYVESAPFNTQYIEKNKTISQLMESYEYYDAYVIPVVDKILGAKWVFSICSRGNYKNSFKQKIFSQKNKINFLASSVVNHIVNTPIIFNPYTKQLNRFRNPLTPREIEVLELASKNSYSYKEVASELGISVKTIENHFSSIRDSLGTTSNIHALYIAIQKGLISVNEGISYNY
jgi:DNA-binding CsgD family transcriptional regulator